MEASPIQRLAPVRTQSDPSRRAKVVMLDGSEPAAGSVSPKLPMIVARGHARQPLRLLLLGAVAMDGGHRERALHADEGADARIAGLEFERREPVVDGAAAGAAVALELHSQQAELAQLGHELDAGK